MLTSTPPTVPSIPVSTFGDVILTSLGPSLTAVLPYAAAYTAFYIGLQFIKGWIGRVKATHVPLDTVYDENGTAMAIDGEGNMMALGDGDSFGELPDWIDE